MKAAFLILAAQQMTATDDTNHRYMDQATREALEKMESAVCGQKLTGNQPRRPVIKCKWVIPESFWQKKWD